MNWRFFGIVLVALLVLDLVWLTLRKQYHSALFYSIQKEPMKLRWASAAVVYLLFAFALTTIVGDCKKVSDAALFGSVVGFVMYGFYDATNYATLNKWTFEMALSDTLWGSVAGGTASALSVWLLK